MSEIINPFQYLSALPPEQLQLDVESAQVKDANTVGQELVRYAKNGELLTSFKYARLVLIENGLESPEPGTPADNAPVVVQRAQYWLNTPWHNSASQAA